jgi:hypothetical protein
MPDPQDLRSTIEAAVAKEETQAANSAAASTVEAVEPPARQPEVPAPESEKASPAPEAEKAEAPEKAEQPEKSETEPQAEDKAVKASPLDKAPQSWKPAAKQIWKELPESARQEVVRREKQITQALSESAGARQAVAQFTDMIQPYRARMESLGMPPLQAINELLKADHILTTAAPSKRAQFMAGLIKEYGVDVRELDAALSGEAPVDQTAAQIEQLVNQRLAPFQQFVRQQAESAQQQRQREAMEVQQSIERMSVDPKFPHFEAVRDTMADLIEISAKRGLYITPEQAYTKAVAMDQDLSAQSNRRQAAEQANARAQRALNASVSVGGAPSAQPSGQAVGSNLRSTIEAAFEKMGGR